jgi:hypothetical protein
VKAEGVLGKLTALGPLPVPELSAINESRQEIAAFEASRQTVAREWESLVKQQLKSKTRFKGPEVELQLQNLAESIASAAFTVETQPLRMEYLRAASKAREAFQTARRALEMANDCSASITMRLAKVREAIAVVTANLLETTRASCEALTRQFAESKKGVPAIESVFTLEVLQQIHRDVQNDITARTTELTSSEDAGQRIKKYAGMTRANEAISHEMTEIGMSMSEGIVELNAGMDDTTQKRIQERVQRRVAAGFLYKNDSSRLQSNSSDQKKPIIRSLVPNLAVQEEVVQVEPATIEEIEATTRLRSNMDFMSSVSDENVAFHTLAAIAHSYDLGFILMPAPSAEITTDAWNKSADFAMEIDVLNESSLFLLGSSCPEHQAKGASLHLRGDL